MLRKPAFAFPSVGQQAVRKLRIKAERSRDWLSWPTGAFVPGAAEPEQPAAEQQVRHNNSHNVLLDRMAIFSPMVVRPAC
eukprot:scaffold142394_cov51-Prasinocladus_malaysianus.AAC.1